MASTRTVRAPTPRTPLMHITEMPRWTPVVRVRGCSMQPTLVDGQVLLTRPAASRVKVGDIVVFTRRSGERCVKRIAAGPGDLVELEAGRLYVDQRPYDGLPRSRGAWLQTWHIPDEHVFVVGDNLRLSDDSRVWQEPFVPMTCITGVVIASPRSSPRARAIA
jgi:signal peptidase I